MALRRDRVLSLVAACLTALAGVMALVGALAPWGSYQSVGFVFTPSGVDEFAGAYVVLAVGVIVLSLSLLIDSGWLGPRRRAGIALVGAVVISVVAGRATAVLHNYALSHLEPGMFVVYASAACLLLAFLAEWLRARPSVRQPQHGGFAEGPIATPGDGGQVT